jgi:hypothetical protein
VNPAQVVRYFFQAVGAAMLSTAVALVSEFMILSATFGKSRRRPSVGGWLTGHPSTQQVACFPIAGERDRSLSPVRADAAPVTRSRRPASPHQSSSESSSS